MRFFLDFKLDYVYSTLSTAAKSEGNAAIQSGGGLPVLGGGDSPVGITFHTVLAL